MQKLGLPLPLRTQEAKNGLQSTTTQKLPIPTILPDSKNGYNGNRFCLSLLVLSSSTWCKTVCIWKSTRRNAWRAWRSTFGPPCLGDWDEGCVRQRTQPPTCTDCHVWGTPLCTSCQPLSNPARQVLISPTRQQNLKEVAYPGSQSKG